MTTKGFLVCFKSDLWIAVRSFSTYFAIVLPTAIAVLSLSMSRLGELTTEARERFSNIEIPLGGSISTGYGNLVDGMLVALTCAVLVVTTYAAWTFANDFRNGTVRHLVTRVTSRHALVLAKIVTIHVLAIVSLVIAFVSAYFLAGSLWTYESVVEDSFELINEMEIRKEILLGLGLALITIPASITLGMFVSVCASSPVQSTVITLAILVIYGLFQPYFGAYAEYCFLTFTPLLFDTSYLREVSDIVRGFSDVYVSNSTIRLNLWIPVIQTIGFCFLIYFITGRRRL
ncbi:MAG: ABC transporter permease subunit [Gammaproteobacteria bacterium]|nr:ABC transporter permease subunit [Gammaproteobacteria bacterium]